MKYYMSRVSAPSVARSPAQNNRRADTRSQPGLSLVSNLQMASGAQKSNAVITSILKGKFKADLHCKFPRRHPPLTSVNLLLIETIYRKHAVNLKNALY